MSIRRALMRPMPQRRDARRQGVADRFEDVAVSTGAGGSWRAFVPGHRFLDGAHTVRDLTAAGATQNDVRYAFLAASS